MYIYNNSLIKKLRQKIFHEFYQLTYSQTGEDIIINLFREAKCMKTFRYLDIGANHPSKLNNTYFFYVKGFSGVSVEPNPVLCKLHKKLRVRDTILDCGVSFNDKRGSVDYYMMNENALNTFSAEEANRMVSEGLARIINVQKINVIPVSEILVTYFADAAPDFLNLDVEGLDMRILSDWNFEKIRPSLICVETVEFTKDASSKKKQDIFDLLNSKGYRVFADTYINTIFFDDFKY